MAEESGASAVAVHGRTREQYYLSLIHISINGNYSIADIRNAIIEERQKKVAEKQVEEVVAPISQPQVRVEEPKEQIKPTPVSYPHLDVYKRQGSDSTVNISLSSSLKALAGAGYELSLIHI